MKYSRLLNQLLAFPRGLLGTSLYLALQAIAAWLRCSSLLTHTIHGIRPSGMPNFAPGKLVESLFTGFKYLKNTQYKNAIR
jgi:hypothetical protein